MLILVKDVQPEKAPKSIHVTFSGSVTSLNAVQLLKKLFGMRVTPLGILILVNDVHVVNEALPKDVSESGKYTDFNDLQTAKALALIFVRFSEKVTDSKLAQSQKAHISIVFTVFGITTLIIFALCANT